jgi:thiol:disulfide interchange protein DsbA
MKIMSRGLAALLLAALAAAGCSRHSAQPAHPAQRRPSDSSVVAVKPEATQAGAAERSTGMAEESESAADVAPGMSPVAAAVAVNTPAAATAIPGKWIQGKNYLSLMPAQPTDVAPDKVEVVEVFWYGCGHCFHLDPTIEAWRKKGKPAYVEFRRVPVMWNEATRAHARLFYTLVALGKLEQLHAAVFNEIHVNGNFLADSDPAKTEQLQRKFLQDHGVSDADFDGAYHSVSMDANLGRAEDFTRRYRVLGVPLLAVNGKYTADVESAKLPADKVEDAEARLMQLVNDLAASEHRH